MAANWKSNEAARANRLASMTDNRAEEQGAATSSKSGQFQGRTALREACMIRVERIVADPLQPRTEFDADSLQRLAASLKARGQLQPIRVRWDEKQSLYVIVLGERRWRASQLAGLDTVSCVVVSGSMTPEEILEDQLLENVLRDDLKPIEQARAYRSLMDRLDLTQRALAEKLNISQGQVMQSLRLLELPESVRESIDSGELAPTVAYQIAQLPDAETQQSVAAEVVSSKLTRAEATERVREVARKPKAKSAKGRGAKPRPVKSRVVRCSLGKVTIELRKAGSVADLVAVLEEAAKNLGAEHGESVAA
jgi:ParB family chromosome partitioning protein